MPSLIELPSATSLDNSDLVWLADMSASPGSRDANVTLASLADYVASVVGGVILRGDTASRPPGAGAGLARLYFDEDEGKVIVHDGTNWVNLDGSSL